MTDNNQEFCNNLWQQIVAAIASGKKSFIFWGFNEALIELLSHINSNGLQNFVTAIIDSNPQFQGKTIGDFKVLSPDCLQKIDIDAVVITSDDQKEEIIFSFSKMDSRKPKIIMAGTGHMQFQDPLYNDLFSSSFISSRAFGYKNMLIHIYQSLQYIARNKLQGSFAEFGVYKGGTTVFMARALESLNIKAKIYAFDTFGGFPPQMSVLDMYDDPHDEFFDFEAVKRHCSPYNIELIKGDITDTYRLIEGIPLVFSFFDTDNYSPTDALLEMCYRQTVSGGILAFDHYYCDERWLQTLGERIAAREFLKDKNVLNLYGTGIFLKI